MPASFRVSPRSSSSSPDDCLPDSTTSTRLFSSRMGRKTHGGITSISSSSTDIGYHSGSAIFSPDMGSVSSRDPDMGSPYLLSDTSPIRQPSPDNPPSVFSPEGSINQPPSVQTQTQSPTPLDCGVSTVQATTQQSCNASIQTPPSCPNSVPVTPTSNSSASVPVDDFPFQELKYFQSLDGNRASYPGQQFPFAPCSHQQQLPRQQQPQPRQQQQQPWQQQQQPWQQPQQPQHQQQWQWNPDTLPSFVKQEPPDFGYGSAKVTSSPRPSAFPNRNAAPMPFPSAMDITSSVIIIGDTDTSSAKAMPQQPGLPVLTGDDLKMLDFIDQLEEESAIRQMPHYSR